MIEEERSDCSGFSVKKELEMGPELATREETRVIVVGQGKIILVWLEL